MASERIEQLLKNPSKSYSGESNDNKYLACDISVLLDEHKSDKSLMDDLLRLQHLKVELIHQVPIQHKIESHAGSHQPSRKERLQFRKFVTLKHGIYSPDEDKIICKNWKKFCKKHNWDRQNIKPFLYMKHGNLKTIRDFHERKKFVQFLANGLPNRTLYSVYQRFRNLYSNHSQKRYTPAEDEMILSYIEENPLRDSKHMHSDLAKILNRTRASVWRRYHLLKRKRREE